MQTPTVYVALIPTLVQELELEPQLARLAGIAQVELWDGPGNPTPAAVANALGRAQVLITGWGTPVLAALAEWTPQDFAVRLVAHTAGTVKQLVPIAAV